MPRSDSATVKPEILTMSAYCPTPLAPMPLAISADATIPVSRVAACGTIDTITSSIALSESKMASLVCHAIDFNEVMIYRSTQNGFRIRGDTHCRTGLSYMAFSFEHARWVQLLL